MVQPFTHSGRPLRIHLDTKHIPPKAVSNLASYIERGGGSISEDSSRADVLVVDPTHPRGFEDFLKTRRADQRPPVVLAFWVYLCARIRQLIWFEHPYWDCVVFPYERLAYPGIPAGVLAYGSFLAGRNCANIVPASELPGQTPGLMADAILATSEHMAQESNVKPAPATSVSLHPSANGVVSAVEPAPGPAGSSDLVASFSSPNTSKRPSSGLKLATVGGSKWKGPGDRLNRASKTQKVPRRTDSLSSQPGPIEAAPCKEPTVHTAQPQANTVVRIGVNKAAAPVATEALRVLTNGAHNDVVPLMASTAPAPLTSNQSDPAPEPIKNGNFRPNGSTTGVTELVRMNGHTATTEPIIDTPSSARPVALANHSLDLSTSQEKETFVSASIVGDSQDVTALGVDLASAIAIPEPSPAAPFADADETQRKKLPPKPPSLMTKSYTLGPHTSNGANGKGKETPAPKQTAQSSIASAIKSTAVALTSQGSGADTAPETVAQPNRPRVRLTFSGNLSRPSNGNGKGVSRPQSNATSNAGSSSSTLSSTSLVTPDQPPIPTHPDAPPHPEVLPVFPGSDKKQWLKDENYMVAYMNWRFKQDPTLLPFEIIKEIAQQLPRRSLDTWRRRFTSYESEKFVHRVRVLGERFHRKTSSVDPKSTNKVQHPTQLVPTPPVEPPSPPPSPPAPRPPTPPPGLDDPKVFTQEEDQFVVDYMNWYFNKIPDAPTADILDDIARMIPRHSSQQWSRRFLSKEDMVYAPKVPQLFGRMTNRISRVNPSGPRTDNPNRVPAAQSVEYTLKRDRKEVDYRDTSDDDGPRPNPDSDSNSDSDMSDDGLTVGGRRRTRSERHPEKKRPRYTV
ncbi:hypothetical protein FRC09_011538 [Ceratobasidium sp. 395]|nr:hypothetical protein FRC09_011538 [Ceratobasidium sp. 395]